LASKPELDSLEVVAILTEDLRFPPAWTADRSGLVAVGGDLSIERLLLAYRNGIFPWPIFDDDLMTWFSPDPRAILELDSFHCSRSLAKLVRKGTFEVTVNRDFAAVIDGCAEPAPERMTTWITPDLMRAYNALHRAGHAHSVEVWRDKELVGGLYGVSIGGLFAGESMFSRVANGSKIALHFLVQRLRDRGYGLLDTQTRTEHLQTLGAIQIPRSTYLKRLKQALQLSCSFV
jgi:leucyl/phenylalanyl-tRNA---protein transferase